MIPSSDDLVRGLARVHDESLTGFARRPTARSLFHEITSQGVPRRVRRRRHLATRMVLAGGLAAASAAGVLVLVRGGSGPAGPSDVRASDVARVTRLVASAARRQPDLNPRNDQFVHIRSVDLVAYSETFGNDRLLKREKLPRSHRDLWLSVDEHQDGLLRTRPCGSHDFCDQPLPGRHRPGPPVPGSTASLRSLPSDPARMMPALETLEYGQPRPELWLKAIHNAVMEQYVPPRIRAAIFEYVGGRPGATIDQNAHDAIGRPGIAIAVPDGIGGRIELVFDRKTYQFLGERTVAGPPSTGRLVTPSPGDTPNRIPKGGPPTGTVTSAFALLDVGIVDHVPAH
jgi:hypothetical protein